MTFYIILTKFKIMTFQMKYCVTRKKFFSRHCLKITKNEITEHIKYFIQNQNRIKTGANFYIVKHIINNMDRKLDNTEEKIVIATFNILQKEGVTKATTKRIAKEAGVNEVTIFRKFENKSNLINVTKDYHMNILIERLREIFDYSEDEEIEDYLTNNFRKMLELSDNDLSVIKIAMEEVRDIPGKKLLISNITDVILDQMEAFFKLQIEKGNIRELDARSLSIMCFSLTFQSVVLWKVYNKKPSVENKQYAENIMDILKNGILKN
ncbi:MAG: TetR/AcrR family transcriptional regulator [Methanobrevibacter sp.]|nr:TetR/AcrR family transcriptional regulator [Methanobrevibacter sp.]